MNNNIKVHTLSLGNMDNFIYIIEDISTKKAMITDPSWDIPYILEYLKKHNLNLVGILLTHTHSDHILGLDDLVVATNIPVYLSETEFNIGHTNLSSPIFVQDGEKVSLGDSEIECIFTPGHTVGSVCYFVENNVFTGDTLFVNGCGRCDFYESDKTKMYSSIQKLKALPDETVVWTGHNYGVTVNSTIEKQKKDNPFMIIENEAFFIKFRMDLHAGYRSIPFPPSSSKEIESIQLAHS